jgi:ketosteroid isomerase-like protein
MNNPDSGKACKFVTVTLLALLASVSRAGDADAEQERVAATLDSLHAYAAQADFDRYFALYAPGAVFLGTDATERWSTEQFKDYARPIFAEGRGWEYRVIDRWIRVSADGNTAWFDERLDNESLGECRGSGVLIRSGDTWLIEQYNLTIPVPNDLAYEFVDRIRQHETGNSEQDGGE